MTTPIHTPGPVRVFSPFGRPEIVTDRATAHETQSVVTQFGEPRAESNARLISAAYNAFDSAARNLGLNAVELAERMQDGAFGELVSVLRDIISEADGGWLRESPLAKRALKVLGGVKGGAS
jgi:hypothetical protein